jgi:hypothetical protein
MKFLEVSTILLCCPIQAKHHSHSPLNCEHLKTFYTCPSSLPPQLYTFLDAVIETISEDDELSHKHVMQSVKSYPPATVTTDSVSCSTFVGDRQSSVELSPNCPMCPFPSNV